MDLSQLNEILNRKLSQLLGISDSELAQLSYGGIKEDKGPEGLMSRFYIQFAETSPKEILSKIPGLNATNVLYIAPELLDEDDNCGIFCAYK